MSDCAHRAEGERRLAATPGATNPARRQLEEAPAARARAQSHLHRNDLADDEQRVEPGRVAQPNVARHAAPWRQGGDSRGRKESELFARQRRTPCEPSACAP
eukprot:638166-Prymnesium_polylepis.1